MKDDMDCEAVYIGMVGPVGGVEGGGGGMSNYDFDMSYICMSTAQKSHYPPGSHHANPLVNMSYFQVITTC